jgi:hypothetical protein
MRGNGYRLLGFAVWHGARWYLRRRLPSGRKVATAGLVAVAAIAGGAVLARRNGG